MSKKLIIIDIILILIFNAVMFFIFGKVDFFEWLYSYVQKYEHLELDEIIPLFFTLSLSLCIFIIRRFVELRVLFANAEKLSTHDHLTGLYNRRLIQGMFDTEMERAIRKHTSFSVLIIDIDDFKNINDNYGHNVGDKVLFQFSEIFKASMRKIDIVSRWGGEEFLILCPETNLNEGILTAQRLISTIRAYEFPGIGHATVSMGVTVVHENETFEHLVNRADECLYKAKNNGKNCYVSA